MSRNQRIKDALKSKGITQLQIAEYLNVKQATINQRLNGSIEIDSVDFIIAVAKLTSTSVEYLVFGDIDEARKALFIVNEKDSSVETLRKTIATLENIVETYKRLLDEYKSSHDVLLEKIRRYEQKHEKS